MVRCFTQGLDTKSLNTCVTGFLRRKRIVFWDPARQALDDGGLPPVLGHELGQYVLGQTVNNIALSAIVVFIALHAAHRWVGRASGPFKERLGLSAVSDFAGLPLVIRSVNLLSLVAAPVEPTFSHHPEHEAEGFALQVTHNNHATRALLKIPSHNLSKARPGMLHALLHSSHPSSGDWIDF